MEGKKLALLGCAAILTAAPAGAQDAGISSEWDIRTTLAAVVAQTNRLQPVLDQVRPKEWIAKGAPEAYQQQYETTLSLVKGVQLSVDHFSRHPEKVTAALDTFFRLQSLETMVTSLAEGIRKYQNPAMADLLAGIEAESSASRQQLRQYLVDLADLKEQEYAVMDKEAQRCRGVLSKQPPAPRPRAGAAKPQKKP